MHGAFLLLLGLLSGLPTLAQEPVPPVQARFTVEMSCYVRIGDQIGSDGEARLVMGGAKPVLHVKLTTPTPGYRIELSPLVRVGGVAKGTLNLIGPKGLVPQVISEVQGTYPLALPAGSARLELEILRDFNWGSLQLLCPLPPAVVP